LVLRVGIIQLNWKAEQLVFVFWGGNTRLYKLDFLLTDAKNGAFKGSLKCLTFSDEEVANIDLKTPFNYIK